MLVLLTRALDEAARTAAKVADAGHHAVLSPVLEMAPTGAAWPGGVVDLVLATSTQGFELFSEEEGRPSAEARRLMPVFVVGERTLAAARERGFEGRGVVAPDARDLATMLVSALAGEAPARLVYLAGRDRKPDLEQALRTAAHEVETVEVYAAQPADALSEEAAELIRAGAVGAVLHYSRRSAQIFLDLARQAGLDVSGSVHVAISQDAAQPLLSAAYPSAARPQVRIAREPKEAAILEALSEVAAQELVNAVPPAKA